MRSSSSCLAVSRRWTVVNPLINEPFEGSYAQGRYGRPSNQPDDVNRLEVRVTVSYKTLVIAFALFSVVARMLDAIMDLMSP